MHRFFVSAECFHGERVTLPQRLAHQLGRVLRLGRGDSILVLDNRGWQYQVELMELSETAVQGRVVARSPAPPEPCIGISLYQALLKADKFEMVLQKGTEVGISHFVPVKCRRSEAGVDVGSSKMERWRRILTEAAEQSSRGRLPTLAAPLAFAQACQAAHDLKLIPWEQERDRGLRAALESYGTQPPQSVAIFIGPEGGFAAEEVALAGSHGVLPVSLGRRVLRAETAGLVAASAVLYHWGELG